MTSLMSALSGWTVAAALLGWVVALVGVGAAVRQRRRFEVADRLVAEAAHELRGPLCAVRLAIATLDRTSDQAGVRQGRLAAIDAELRRAGLAVDDLAAAFDATRAGARRELFDLHELLAESEPVWESVAGAHGAVLHVHHGGRPAVVLANRMRLAQAIGNLVANGCEHGGGVIGVQVRASGERLRVEVSDQGPGLPAPVSELSRRTMSRRGSRRTVRAARGHGLAVAGRVAEELGGRLAAAPARRGARLVLELPAARPPAAWGRRSS
jgi:signal transduction histidine kinase